MEALLKILSTVLLTMISAERLSRTSPLDFFYLFGDGPFLFHLLPSSPSTPASGSWLVGAFMLHREVIAVAVLGGMLR